MVLAYGVGGLLSVSPGPVTGIGAPGLGLTGQLGQQYFDLSTEPHTEYIWDGEQWTVGGVNPATPTTPGIVYLATDAQAIAGTPSTPTVPLAVQPSNLSPVFGSPPALGATLPNSAVVTTLEVTGLATMDASADVFTAGAPLNLGTDNSSDDINIGLGTSARDINIATSNAAHQIVIGTQTIGETITEYAGDSWTVDGLPGTVYSLGASTSTGTISIGGTSQAGLITVGNSLASSTVKVASGSGDSTVTICENATGANTVSICNGATTQTNAVNILSGVGVAGGGTLALGNNPRVSLIEIGNVASSGLRNISISGGAATQNENVTILGGANTAGSQQFSVLNGNNNGSSSTCNFLCGTIASGTHTFNVFNAPASGGTLTANIFGSSANSNPGLLNLGTGSAGHNITIGSIADPCKVSIRAGETDGISLSASGTVSMTPRTTSAADPTSSVTLDNRVGHVTFTGFTILTGNLQSFTINNSFVTLTSAIFTSVSCIDVSGNMASIAIFGSRQYAGSLVVDVINLGGDLIPGDNLYINFWVIN